MLYIIIVLVIHMHICARYIYVCMHVFTCTYTHITYNIVNPGGSVVKNLPASVGDAEDTVSIPGSGRSPGEGNGTPHQYSCLGDPMDREAWWATVQWGCKRFSD